MQRNFRGVMGDRANEGELFGVKNVCLAVPDLTCATQALIFILFPCSSSSL